MVIGCLVRSLVVDIIRETFTRVAPKASSGRVFSEEGLVSAFLASDAKAI